MQPFFSVPKQPREAVLAGQQEDTFLDKINNMIIEGDKHYSKFKFDRRSNFKHGIINSLSVYENEAVLAKQIGQMALIGGMYTDKTDYQIQEAEETKEESKGNDLTEFIAKVVYSEADAEYDFCGTDQEAIAKALV